MKEYILVAVLLLVLNFGEGKIKLIKYGIAFISIFYIVKYNFDIKLTFLGLLFIYSPSLIVITIKFIYKSVKKLDEKIKEDKLEKVKEDELIRKAFGK